MESTKTAINFIINLMFISIPQGMAMMTLVIFTLKEHEMFKKENFRQTVLDVFVIGVLGSSLIMNALYYYTSFNLLLRLSLNAVIFYIFVNHIIKFKLKKEARNVYLNLKYKEFRYFDILNNPELYDEHLKTYRSMYKSETNRYVYEVDRGFDKLKYKRKGKAALYSVVFIAVGYVLEMSTIMYLDYMFNFDVRTISFSIINTIMLSYPTLIIFAFSIYMCYRYANNKKITLFNIWRENNKFRMITYIQGVTTFSFSVVVYYIYNKTNLFESVDADTVYKINMTLFTLLILHIIIPWIFRYIKISNKRINSKKNI